MKLADYFIDAPWKEKAACRDADHNLFFPSQGAMTSKPAKAICAGCTVREPCLEEALRGASFYDFGVWGGTTPRERQKLRKQRRAAA